MEGIAIKLTAKQRRVVFAMFDGHCAYCGQQLDPRTWHADHIKPVMRDGKWERCEVGPWTHRYVQTGECARPDLDRLDNLYPACRACNINKGAESLEQWRKWLERSVEAIRRDHAIFRHAERFGLVQATGAKVVFYFERCNGRAQVSLHSESTEKEPAMTP